jgi:ATP-dependent protease ClpP protease subunit
MKPAPKFYALEKTGDNETTIHLYDEVGAFGAGSKDFLADLGKLDGEHIHLRINSPGGSVIEGTAIYNALRRHQGGLTVHIDALAASMASVIAMAGAPVYMADNALMMIHNPWTVSMGDSDQLRREADLLDKLKSTLVNAYKRKSGMEEKEIAQMMDKETWLDAVEAVALGFADAIEEGVAAAATASPEQLRARFDTFAKGMTAEKEMPVIEAAPEAPVAEEPAATIVSESVPPADSSDLPEQSEPPVAEEQLAEPQAKASAAADAILSKYNAAIVERDAAVAEANAYRAKFEALSAEVESLRASLSQDREALARLERSLGLQAAETVPFIQPQSDNVSDPVAEYLAAVEAGDRKAASALFEKHKAAIWNHRQKISKASR